MDGAEDSGRERRTEAETQAKGGGPPPGPSRATWWGIGLYSTAVTATGIYYVIDRVAPWAFVLIGAGLLTALLAWRSPSWISALFRVLFLNAFALFLAGPLTGLDIYVVGFAIYMAVLCIGVVLHHSVETLRDELRRR
jgi:hypothetical protein